MANQISWAGAPAACALLCLGACSGSNGPPRSIGGEIAGLSGPGLVLVNGSDKLSVPADARHCYSVAPTYRCNLAGQPPMPKMFGLSMGPSGLTKLLR